MVDEDPDARLGGHDNPHPADPYFPDLGRGDVARAVFPHTMAGAAEQGATLSEAEAVAMNELDLAGAAERRIAEGVFARVKAEIEAEQVPAWQRYGYSSEEAFIEHNAGASPHGLSSLPDMPTEEACLDAACVAVLMQIMREPDPKIILVLAQAYKELRLNG